MCLAGLKDRYRQHHAAILHGQTAFDAVLASEGGVLPGDQGRNQEDGEGGQHEGDSELVSCFRLGSCFLVQRQRVRKGESCRAGARLFMADPQTFFPKPRYSPTKHLLIIVLQNLFQRLRVGNIGGVPSETHVSADLVGGPPASNPLSDDISARWRGSFS